MVRKTRRVLLFFAGCIIGSLLGRSLQFIKQRQYCAETPDLHQQQEKQEQQQKQQKHHFKRKKFIYAGVITAKKFLDSRAQAVYSTWGKELPGDITFFASGITSNHKELPIVSLNGVDDTYPPQRKSFMMLKYMHDNHINDYEWFLRADDDLYVHVDKLETFLRRLNSSQISYIGHTGYGGSDKIRKLLNGNTFCMGGPGMIFSASTLRRIVPYIDYWLRSMTRCKNEDVELGRLMKHFGKINCSSRPEMKQLFYHSFESSKNAYAGKLDTKIINSAITLHPFKKPELMYRMHLHLKNVVLQERDYFATRLHKILNTFNVTLSRGIKALLDYTHTLFKHVKTTMQHVSTKIPSSKVVNKYSDIHQGIFTNYTLTGSMFTSKKIYRPSSLHSPEAGVSALLKLIVKDFTSGFNKNSASRSELSHGYVQFHPVHGFQYILYPFVKDHHQNGQQQNHKQNEKSNKKGKKQKKQMQQNPKKQFGPGTYIQQQFNKVQYSSYKIRDDEVVNIILPLAGRLPQFEIFLKTYDTVCLKPKERTTLLITYFPDHSSSDKHLELFNALKRKYPEAILKWIKIKGSFSRSIGLNVGASHYSNNSLLFFCDVDMVFNSAFLTRCRTNTKAGSLLYFPIVFSQYSPEIAFYNKSQPVSNFSISEETGVWRIFGYGLSCQYHSDFDSVGRFDDSIKGWGLEDVNLYNRYVKIKTQQIVRVNEPGLVHVYHEKKCAKSLGKKYAMCLGSRHLSYGSPRKLQTVLRDKGFFE